MAMVFAIKTDLIEDVTANAKDIASALENLSQQMQCPLRGIENLNLSQTADGCKVYWPKDDGNLRRGCCLCQAGYSRYEYYYEAGRKAYYCNRSS